MPRAAGVQIFLAGSAGGVAGKRVRAPPDVQSGSISDKVYIFHPRVEKR
jgi:hypothetical protein